MTKNLLFFKENGHYSSQKEPELTHNVPDKICRLIMDYEDTSVR